MKDPIWFSPLNVIYHYHEIIKSGALKGGDRRIKKLDEAYAVAVMLTGMILLQKREFWMQVVPDAEERPDIRTGCYRLPRGTSGNSFITQDIEVVTFEEHSTDSFENFLKRTKLLASKNYDEFTTILCYINKDYCLSSLENLNQQLLNTTQNPVMFVGRNDPNKPLYKSAQILPNVDYIQVLDPYEELQNLKLTGVLKLKRGFKAKLSGRTGEENFPFENINLIPGRDYEHRTLLRNW